MTPFQSMLARLCIQAGATIIHVDVAGGEAPDAVGDHIGHDGLATLRRDHEVQILVEGDIRQSEMRGHMMTIGLVSALSGVAGCSVMCVNGDGAVTLWNDVDKGVMERVAPEVREAALARRLENAQQLLLV